ncbi:PIR protein [Plasmodium yoelii]|uniref:PIR protein n=2 Tax=Plasmodium yoelii TaxID=5861 RepID=A0AAF0B182_PLAYO|nr:PIR protein [Plasmodium yoelii]WBY54646.1 PIR protein [Plasmodium yoelii yoelii]VTZ71639.1 PIR protein [Plasmodium yoelii]|eukprot:XP_022810965.1 PIR protein [Plasmodium yoelii]
MPVYLCDGINLMDRGILFDQDSQNYTLDGSHTNMHCPDNKCDDDNKKLSSAFIAFITFFNGTGIDETLDSDKIAEYAILWLGHKLNQKKENETTTLNDFYTKHVETNSHYNQKMITNSSNKIKKNDIEKKIKSMNIGIKDMSNFYEVFKLLCKMDGELDPKKKPQCNKCLESAREFFEKCEKVKNAFDINKGSSYLQLLSILSNDYKKFKEKYKQAVCSNVEFLETCSRSSVTESPVTKCPVAECQVTECPVTECPVTETPLTKNTLITIAIIFVAASILLGVSYKYSLFGFRKRSQKQHLREKLKK